MSLSTTYTICLPLHDVARHFPKPPEIPQPPVDGDVAFDVPRLEPGQDVHEGALPRSRRAHDRSELAGVERTAHT